MMRLPQRRLLAVRVSTATEYPDESAALIASALFGDDNADSRSGSASVAPLSIGTSVTSHYRAVSHGRLQFVPAVVTNTTTTAPSIAAAALDTDQNDDTTDWNRTNRNNGSNVITHTANGVLDVTLSNGIVFSGNSIHDLMPAIVDATQRALTRRLLQVADTVVFCLPTGSLLDANDNESSWTAFSYLWEPVRVFVYEISLVPE
jgi:hypothetical protein